jgi:hypothetical protein
VDFGEPKLIDRNAVEATIILPPPFTLPYFMQYQFVLLNVKRICKKTEKPSEISSGVPRGFWGVQTPPTKFRNFDKVPKIKKNLLYEMKFLVPNYSCLQKP